ncbi:MAG: fatty acid cis/trans isomerase [Gammaproteobacteria bacterium]|nr:fatty acid cis/trans isomerase [Gammaproteobacteria bacterium]
MDSNFCHLHHSTCELFWLAALLLLASCSSTPPSVTEELSKVDYGVLLTMPEEPILYDEQVRPVLEQRCVVCHGCTDAPCQLKLSSYEGITRGASKVRVYNGTRLSSIPPSRLFIDAQTTAEWRSKGFHPVLAENADTPEGRLEESVLYQLLHLKQLHPQPKLGMLPDSMDTGLNRKQVCTTREQFDNYARQHPDWGMPYAMPNLRDEEYRTLVQWLAQGVPPAAAQTPSGNSQAQLERWEAFLNDTSLKQQLTSRYLYEHLFQAHIHFEGTPTREFYRLVRSSTPPGQPVQEIATVRPYDSPGSAPFYYRLWLYPASIVAKTHMVYTFSDARMARYRELFLEPEYRVTELPSYEVAIASNPFKAFRDIPVNSRYRFLLDDAHFIIEGFIKGPVCRGQIALNVIEDRFWVVFADPDADLASSRPEFLDEMSSYLALPSQEGSTLRILRTWRDYARRQNIYINARFSNLYNQASGVGDLQAAMNYIWDGDGHNPNAALTIYRHFDSASVEDGFVGEFPDSAWVIDYPLLERIHYLLVTGFNVYGNAGHQLLTRLYMDFLRMEGEDNFLVFIPVSDRRKILDSWYVGIRSNMEKSMGSMDWLEIETVSGYKTDDPQGELYEAMIGRLGPLAGAPSYLYRCTGDACVDRAAGKIKQQADRAMRTIAGLRGEQLKVFPDVALVHIQTENPENDLAYTVIRNKAYTDVTSMFSNERNRDTADIEHDTLTVVEGIEGSYPNFFFVVEPAELEDFTSRTMAVRTPDDYERLIGVYGVRRTSDAFWETADWFQDYYATQDPLLYGILDLNRYANR